MTKMARAQEAGREIKGESLKFRTMLSRKRMYRGVHGMWWFGSGGVGITSICSCRSL